MGQTSPMAEICELVKKRIEAVRTKNIDMVTNLAAFDLVLFDIVNPLQTTGSDGQRRRLADWLSSFEGPVGFEIRELSVSANEGLGFSHGLCHVSATTRKGSPLEMYWRWTACFQKTNGDWKITHEHNSVPFDVSSGMASLDLKP
jgi:ketosteroid isomerase-like protein